MGALAAMSGTPGDAMGGAGMGSAGMSGIGTNPGAADWSCLGAPPTATPGVSGSGNVRYAVLVRSLSGLPINNLVVRSCETADLSCASPLSEGRGISPEGLAELEVPIGFAGFLELEMDAHVPTLVYMRRPVLHDMVELRPILPIPEAALAQLSGLLNIEILPELGILTLSALDCRGERSPGASFSNNLGGRNFYFIAGLPNLMSASTDIQGLGGFVNVPQRLVEVSASVAADGRLIDTRTLYPRPGWIVAVALAPPSLPVD
ncbi:MAG: hypothetical protein RL033_196 [Pseudomonadota bacterium]